MLIRLTSAALLAAVLLAGPAVADAAVATAVTTPVPKPVTPEVLKLPAATPSPAPAPTLVTGPPQNPSTPTVWLKPYGGGKQIIISSINESMTDNGKGCMTFTITAPLNANVAVALLQDYNQHTPFADANVYAGPVVYELINATMKRYSASTTSARFTLIAAKTITRAGSQMTDSNCSAG